jgi:ring-1,2-phenylacetyl-CoA epoxidase subunit PaaC
MSVASIEVSETPLVLYTLRRADDALILGHRLSEWCGHAPTLEEDMALANMGLDLLGQARELYGYAAKVEGKDNDEDKFAYLRDVRQYRNLLLVEQPNGDFARTMVRQFFYAVYADLYWRAIQRCDTGRDRGQIRKGKRLPRPALLGMDRPARRRYRGKPSPRASCDR